MHTCVRRHRAGSNPRHARIHTCAEQLNLMKLAGEITVLQKKRKKKKLIPLEEFRLLDAEVRRGAPSPGASVGGLARAGDSAVCHHGRTGPNR